MTSSRPSGRATRCGGTVAVDPFLVSGVARIALILDSVGAVVGLWEPIAADGKANGHGQKSSIQATHVEAAAYGSLARRDGRCSRARLRVHGHRARLKSSIPPAWSGTGCMAKPRRRDFGCEPRRSMDAKSVRPARLRLLPIAQSKTSSTPTSFLSPHLAGTSSTGSRKIHLWCRGCASGTRVAPLSPQPAPALPILPRPAFWMATRQRRIGASRISTGSAIPRFAGGPSNS